MQDAPTTADDMATTADEHGMITAMKLRGQPRPQEITQERWNSVVVTNTDARADVAFELRNKFIQRLASGLGKPIHEDVKENLGQLADLALEQIVELMTTAETKDTVKAQLAMYLLDHKVGKAKQEIELSGSLALEVRAQLRAEREQLATGMREVSPEKVVDKPQDAMDAFLSKHASDDFVVGKKGTVDEQQGN